MFKFSAITSLHELGWKLYRWCDLFTWHIYFLVAWWDVMHEYPWYYPEKEFQEPLWPLSYNYGYRQVPYWKATLKVTGSPAHRLVCIETPYLCSFPQYSYGHMPIIKNFIACGVDTNNLTESFNNNVTYPWDMTPLSTPLFKLIVLEVGFPEEEIWYIQATIKQAGAYCKQRYTFFKTYLSLFRASVYWRLKGVGPPLLTSPHRNNFLGQIN